MLKITQPKISEHDHQANLFSWAALTRVKYPELALLYAIPNAAKRSMKLAAIMKAEGLKSGVPDVCLPVARQGFNALYIEMKSEKGKLKASQEVWLKMLNQAGNKAVVCRSFDEAKAAIEEYLS